MSRTKKIYAHGAVNPVCLQLGDPKQKQYFERESWIYFGASVGKEDYPVVFNVKDVPELIEWLQTVIQKRTKK